MGLSDWSNVFAGFAVGVFVGFQVMSFFANKVLGNVDKMVDEVISHYGGYNHRRVNQMVMDLRDYVKPALRKM